MKDDQLRSPVAVQVRDRNAATCVVVAKPAGNLGRSGPPARHDPVGIQIPADAVVAVIRAGGVIDMKDDQLRPPVAIQIRNCDAATFVVVAEPAGNLDWGDPNCDLPIDIQVAADAIVAGVGARGIVDVEDDHRRRAGAIHPGDGGGACVTVVAKPTRHQRWGGPVRRRAVGAHIPTNAEVSMVGARRIVNMKHHITGAHGVDWSRLAEACESGRRSDKHAVLGACHCRIVRNRFDGIVGAPG